MNHDKKDDTPVPESVLDFWQIQKASQINPFANAEFVGQSAYQFIKPEPDPTLKGVKDAEK